MNEQQQFLEAAYSDWDNDVPRLVYADWLDRQPDQGSGVRAEYIRLSCQAACVLQQQRAHLPETNFRLLNNRKVFLANRHRGDLLGPLAELEEEGLGLFRFERGLIASVVVCCGKSRDFRPLGDAILRQLPRLPMVQFVEEDPDASNAIWESLAHWDQLDHLEGLQLAVPHAEPETFPWQSIQRVLDSPKLTNLRHLELHTPLLQNTPLIVSMAKAKHWGGLQTLELTLGEQDSEALKRLVSASHLGSLRRLRLSGDLGSEHLTAVAGGVLSNLESLTLTANQGDQQSTSQRDWTGLVESASFARLDQLVINGFSISLDGLQSLACSQHVRTVQSVDLSNNWLQLGSGDALADSPLLAGLQQLALRYDGLRTADVLAIANSPAAVDLKHLDLTGNRFSDRGISSLAVSRNLPQLRTLKISAEHLTDVCALQMVKSPSFGNLQLLELSNPRFSPAWWNRLVKRFGHRLIIKEDFRFGRDEVMV